MAGLANMLSLDGDRVIPSVRTTPYVEHEYGVSVVVDLVHALDCALDVCEDARRLFAIRRSHALEIGDAQYAYAVARFHNSASAIAKRRARHGSAPNV